MVDEVNARAVMYVRMSTESQDYSTNHQRAKIQEYARKHGIAIIREYADDGKSGLDIKRRAGLRSLMSDVQSVRPDFSHILVYDISRWGRFQDIDEAAYHEHTCRRVGIEVIYCGEHFSGNGGPYDSLLKSMKRVMAAEYSRELSEKVFVAQCRFIKMGFKQGGHAGYGLRRLAIKASGEPRAVLEYGEAKVSATDRVILIHGPVEEVATIRRIYSCYLNDQLSEAAIVRLLRNERMPSEFGRPWTQAMVHSVLSNIKYCGALAYNRRSSKLSNRRTCNARDDWIVNSDAVEPIISLDLFEQVQVERARRLRRYTRPELLALLQACYQRHGKVNAKVIAADSAMPDPQLFVRSFGSLVNAYTAAALPRSLTYAFVETKSKLSVMRHHILVQVEALAHAAGGNIEHTSTPFEVILNGDIRLQVGIAVPRTPRRGAQSWKVSIKPGLDFIIVGRMDPARREIIDYFLISSADIASGSIYLKASNLEHYAALRFRTIDAIFGNPTVIDEATEC
ncbi:recombinase family protein [Pseudomonas syringae pv. pisi]|jgi:DNA invertase Pin-like site-specific DNA recombinase